MKGNITLSIDINILSLIKSREDIKNLSEFVENLFRVELEMPSSSNNQDNIKLLNSRLASDNAKMASMIKEKNLIIDKLKEKLEKKTKESIGKPPIQPIY